MFNLTYAIIAVAIGIFSGLTVRVPEQGSGPGSESPMDKLAPIAGLMLLSTWLYFSIKYGIGWGALAFVETAIGGFIGTALKRHANR